MFVGKIKFLFIYILILKESLSRLNQTHNSNIILCREKKVNKNCLLEEVHILNYLLQSSLLFMKYARSMPYVNDQLFS